MAKKPASWHRNILKMLFKEVLEQIPEEHLVTLIDGYHNTTRNIVFVLGESKGGKHSKTAFSAFTVPHSEWKLYYSGQMTRVPVPPVDENEKGSVN